MNRKLVLIVIGLWIGSQLGLLQHWLRTRAVVKRYSRNPVLGVMAPMAKATKKWRRFLA